MKRLGLSLLVIAAITGIARSAVAPLCYNYLTRQTYPNGFTAGNFSNSSQVSLVNGKARLNTALQPIDTEHIVLPFDQDVSVKYVYESAGGSHSMGWFYYDQVAPFLDVNGKPLDQDADGVPDFLQTKLLPNRPNTGLFKVSVPGVPDLTSAALNLSDGGNWPHIPNLLESYVTNGGGNIFGLCDDDGDFSTGGGPGLLPLNADASGSNDGIPDYDVNGDGQINVLDRTVSLGTIQGGREVVFYYMMYYGQTVKKHAMGITGGGEIDTQIMPFFTKSQLNPDDDALGTNSTIRTIDIGCGYPATCAGTQGWLDQSTLDRLNTAPYQNLVLPHEVKTIASGPEGYAPHVFLGAPSTDPNRWLIGLEDLVVYSSGSCANCTHADRDYNDVVVLIERTNGGQLTSQNVSSEIPLASKANTTISKIRITWAANFPPPCTQPPDSRIDLFWSVDDGATWRQAIFPQNSPWDTTIDVLDQGISGADLRWRAEFVTPVEGCQPELSSFNIGYEALTAGEYQFVEPIPAANVMLRATLETTSANWVVTGKDRSPRGHLRMLQLSDPDTHLDSLATFWDAGALLAARNPDQRALYYNNAGTATLFQNTPALSLAVLPPAIRNARVNGDLVYDLNDDGVVDDTDAGIVVSWTRGWEVPNQQRAWKLGAIDHSTPALVGPPGHPWWLDGAKTPGPERIAYTAFTGANKTRQTITVVGASDGIIHAFNAGHFQYGDNPTTGAQETRGYFLKTNNVRDYGDGSEVWGFVPESQVDLLKNNYPRLAGYEPDLNPRADIDGSITVQDIFIGGAFRTVAFAAEGETHPYLTAVDITNPVLPEARWVQDWTDADFHGVAFSPAVGPTTTSGGRRFALAVSSGLSISPDDLYLYLIAADTGATLQKTKLNVGLASATAFGVAGSPVMVDADGDGEVDRVYVADTSGRLFKVNTASNQVCKIGSTGETVYSPIAVQVELTGASPRVKIFVAGGDSPDLNDTVGAYHLTAFQDSDGVGGCSAAQTLFAAALPAGHKVWAAPVTDGTEVFIATTTANRLDVCDNDPNNPGQLFGFSTGDNGGQAVALFAPINLTGGGAVGGLRAYDGHLFVNSISGTTTLLGAPKWNNPQNGAGSGFSLATTAWSEP